MVSEVKVKCLNTQILDYTPTHYIQNDTYHTHARAHTHYIQDDTTHRQTHTHTRVRKHTHIIYKIIQNAHIHTHRERERERERSLLMNVLSIPGKYIYIYIYIYIILITVDIKDPGSYLFHQHSTLFETGLY